MSDGLARVLAEAGGPGAPPTARAQLRDLLLERLRDGAAELERPRSGYRTPVCVAVAAAGEPPAGAEPQPAEPPGGGAAPAWSGPALLALAPVEAALRADPARAGERGWLLVAALVGALVEAGGGRADDSALLAGVFADRWLALALPAGGADAEVAALAFEEQVASIDRLRAVALAFPAHVLEEIRDLRPPVGPANQLRVAEAVARLGGRPADERTFEQLEEAVVARLAGPGGAGRPHDDPLAERRVARRILQRLAGMGKWGGYHTAFDHLARGFEGNERRLAQELGERLLEAGLLESKPSVGQRHVFLNPRRAREIYALVDEGVVPRGLRLD